LLEFLDLQGQDDDLVGDEDGNGDQSEDGNEQRDEGDQENEQEQPDGDDDEPSHGINLVTGDKNQDNNEITSHMFDHRLSENASNEIIKKKTQKSKVAETERNQPNKQLEVEDHKSQDSLIEYEKIISEKLELKRKEELK
jgi:hypothetical protein